MMTIRRLSVVSAVLCTVISADVADAQTGIRARIQREILEKQKKMREGNVIRANVRVTVRLNNGSRMRGVVKDGRFIERPDRIAFVATNVKSENSGLRLWYSNNTNSYIFLPYHSIKRYRIGEKLTDAEVEVIAQRIDESRRQAALRRVKQLEKRRQESGTPQPADNAVGGESGAPIVVARPGRSTGEAAPSKLSASQQALLQQFPPTDGWSLDRLQTLERRKTTIGVYPNKREAEFIDKFATWNEAYEVWVNEQGAADVRPVTRQPAPSGESVDSPVKPSRIRKPTSRPSGRSIVPGFGGN